jgi:hypothetical protein
MYSISTVTLEVRLRMQLNSVLFRKTLVVKGSGGLDVNEGEGKEKIDEEGKDGKAQIMNLMTTDVDRVSRVLWHFYLLFGAAFFFCYVADYV